MAKTNVVHTVGKRKTAVARLYMQEGSGVITINKRDIDDYYLRATSKMVIRQPLELTGTNGKYDISVNVYGGGLSGQAEAIRHAISRALSQINTEAYRPILKSNGLITRDARKKERKLYGQRGARARYQFSKR